MKPLEKTNVPAIKMEKGLNPDELINWWAVSAIANVQKIIADEVVNF